MGTDFFEISEIPSLMQGRYVTSTKHYKTSHCIGTLLRVIRYNSIFYTNQSTGIVLTV